MWKNRDLSANDCPNMASASILPELIIYLMDHINKTLAMNIGSSFYIQDSDH